VPLNCGCADEVIYFHCALEGRRQENLQAKSNASFCVVGGTEVLPGEFSTRYESVIVHGEAVEVLGEEKQNGLVALLKKYSPGLKLSAASCRESSILREVLFILIAC
jgi:nitroimidazol reductase NimA-like FMN-containing flavoprotein (pyridoxamine 5'-phosphate oxidase superfamily)